MVTIVNLDSRKVVAVNDGFTRITGYGRDEAIGRTTQDLGLWIDDKQRERLFNQIESVGVVENVDIGLRRKEGQEVLCQFSCRVIELDGHLHSVSISRDVTALKTAEASLNQAMEDLEDRVEERTRALRQEILEREAIERSLQEANEKLEERVEERGRELESEITERVRAQNDSLSARDEAERADRAKTVFLANMSHELRTPLNSIIGFSDVLASQMFGPLGREQYVDYARDINESGRQLLELVNDILDISRIEVDAITLNEMHVDIGRLLKTCMRSTEKNIADAGLTLECAMGESLPALYADERRVRQILLNLISNARKFTPAGGDVRIAASLEPDGRISLRVSDTGIGIAPEDMATALSTFGQADDDLSRRFPGGGHWPAAEPETRRIARGELDGRKRGGQGNRRNRPVSTGTNRFPSANRGSGKRAAERIK